MIANGEEHVKVTGRASPGSGVAFTGHTKPCSGVDPGRDVDPQLLAHLFDTLATTGPAGIRNHLARTATVGALGDLGETAEGSSGGTAHLPGAATGAAGGGSTARFGTAAAAGVAGLQMRDLDLLLLTEHRLLEINRQVVTKVIPLLRALTPRPTSSSTPGSTKALEKRLEQIRESAHVPHVGSTGRTTKSGFTELVITGPGLGITEHLVGAADFLETVFSSRILVDVGVVLTRHAPISPLEAVGIHIPADAEQVVEVGHQASSAV